MDINGFINHLKKISTEEKSVLVPGEEIYNAMQGEIIPNKIDNYSTMTLEMLKLSADDKKYYKEIYNRLIEKHDSNITFRTINDDGVKKDFAFNKFRIIDAFEWADENNRLTNEEKEKYKLLKMSVEFNKFIESYSKDTSSTIIEGEFVNLPVKSFIDLMTAEEEKLNEIISSGKYLGYDLDKFVYALDDFLDKNHIIDKFHIPTDVSTNLAKISENVDIMHINRCVDYEYTYLDKTKVNPSFKEEIFSSIPEDFDTFEKAFYIYYKMCLLLTYDEEYFAKRSLQAKNIHKDFTRLPNITKENNKVICYEFNAIYARLLKDLGIKYELNGSHNYGEGHAYLTFRIDKFLVNADSTVGMIKSDLGYAKNGLLLTGFTIENTNEKTKKLFEEKVDKVYNYIKSNNDSNYKHTGTVRELAYLEKALSMDLSLEEKVAIFISMCKDSTLEVMDRIPYEIKLKGILFKDNKKEKEQFAINYISCETDPNRYQTTKILTYNKKGIDNVKTNKYIFIDQNSNMHKTNLDEIKDYLSLGIYKGLLNDKHTIPGITLDEMNGKVEYNKKESINFSTINNALNKLEKLTELNNQEVYKKKTHK